MKRFAFLLLIGLLVLLAACGEGQEVAVEHTAVPTPLPTIEPTVTETAVAAPATVVEETAVPTHTITPTFTLMPTITPTPERFVRFETGRDGQPYPAVPFTDVDPANYQITKPDVAILFQILLLTTRETCNYDHESYYFTNYAFRDLFRMLKFEYDQFTDEELEKTIWLLEDTGNCLGEGLSHYVPAVIPQALQLGTVNFLNQNEITFEPSTQALPEIDFRAISIDYDPLRTEWLIEATFFRYDLRIFVPIYEDEFGTYHLIPNNFTPQQIRSLFGRELRTDIDFTGDGINEIIVVTQIDGSTAVGYPGFIEMFSWDDGTIKMLNTLWIGNESAFSAAYDTEYTVEDFNGDSVPDIEVFKPHYDFNFPNCNWLEKHLYSWQGTEAISTIEFVVEPNRSECTSPDMEYAGSPLLIESTLLVDSVVYDDSSAYVYDETSDDLRYFVRRYTFNMQMQILSEHDLSNVREILLRTLARMDAEGSYYQPSQLMYLLGLDYELSGEEETAVATYLDLIQHYPTSPWSWLAWARLEPVEN
jgi:hypothetical protein